MRFFEEAKHIAGAIFGVVAVAGILAFFIFRNGGATYVFPLGKGNATSTASSSSEFGSDSVKQDTRPSNKRLPARKWDMFDPTVDAKGVLIQSLDENFPFFRYQSREQWPAASLTKLLTAVVVLEEYGDKKKVPITARAMQTYGIAGGLSSGEVYLSGDLLKIMLLSSSNRAATAFEDFGGGVEEFNWKLNRKAAEIGMKDTILHDASGLSDLNFTTAEDMFLLTKYIYEKHPEIFNWTRLNNYLVQPVNTAESHTVTNIHPFVDDRAFLGGKTGTSDAAKQNLVSVFSFKDFRIAVIILGSPDRVAETRAFLTWIEKAYDF
jgi:D-alanyl-D-alanine carboxypeptidase